MKKDKDGYTTICDGKDDIFLMPSGLDVRLFCDDNKYFFKANSFGSILEGELLASLLGKKLGLNVVQYQPARYITQNDGDIYGVIAPNFFKDKFRVNYYVLRNGDLRAGNKSQKYAELCEMVQNYINVCNTEKPEFNLCLDARFYRDLQGMIFFDFLTFQADRYMRNIDFVIQKQDNKHILQLAPIFDNSLIFGYEYLMENKNTLYKKDLTQEELKFIAARLKKTAKFAISFGDGYSYKSLEMHIKNLLQRNDYFAKMAKRALRIDMTDCIAQIKQKYPKIKFDEDFFSLANYSWNKTRKTLFDMLKQLDMLDENLQKLEV